MGEGINECIVKRIAAIKFGVKFQVDKEMYGQMQQS